VSPGTLAVAPGDSTRFYAVLEVTDSAAPTRRISTGIEYTQVLPIVALGGAIVRPELTGAAPSALQWHVNLNGQTLLLQPATETKLPLDPILAKGGLGEYQFTLEAPRDNTWIPVSNEVIVVLALPPTATPLPGTVLPASGTLVAITSPTPNAGASTPSGGPATPTRRPVPRGTGGATPTPTPSVVAAPTTPTVTPVRSGGIFWADVNTLKSGGCTNLHWSVENVVAVYLDNTPVTGKESREVCPTQTTVYTLRVVSGTGTQDYPVTIVVDTSGQPTIEFKADAYQVVKGECTYLHWRVTNVRSVFLNNQGVAGESSQKICPETDTTYELRVEDTDGVSSSKRLVITVLPTDSFPMRFWAERYTLLPGGCTTLHWDVQNVREVYLDEQGVPGVGAKQVCPSGVQFYTLRAVDNANEGASQEITLLGNNPVLSAPEVIVQGVVKDVAPTSDIDPTQPGAQTGYRLAIDGVNPLFTGTPGWSLPTLTLDVPQSFISQEGGPVDWPINPGQQVEFRATCTGSQCTLQSMQGTYLRLRSL
jgi:hypothetical protein